MNNSITVKAELLRYGDIVINRACICEARIDKGKVLMNSGTLHLIPPDVLKAWFSDTFDYKQGETK